MMDNRSIVDTKSILFEKLILPRCGSQNLMMILFLYLTSNRVALTRGASRFYRLVLGELFRVTTTEQIRSLSKRSLMKFYRHTQVNHLLKNLLQGFRSSWPNDSLHDLLREHKEMRLWTSYWIEVVDGT